MSASAVLKLQKVGFTIEQVEALADLVDIQAASKADLAEAKAELKADVAAVKADLMEAKAGLRADLVEVEHHLESKIANVLVAVADSKTDILRWVFAAVVGQTALIITLLKFWH